MSDAKKYQEKFIKFAKRLQEHGAIKSVKAFGSAAAVIGAGYSAYQHWDMIVAHLEAARWYLATNPLVSVSIAVVSATVVLADSMLHLNAVRNVQRVAYFSQSPSQATEELRELLSVASPGLLPGHLANVTLLKMVEWGVLDLMDYEIGFEFLLETHQTMWMESVVARRLVMAAYLRFRLHALLVWTLGWLVLKKTFS